MAEDSTALDVSMAEGEMTVGSFHTKGFRLYSLILLALIGFLVAAALNSPAIGALQTVLIFLLGVFTGKKA